MGGRLEGKSIIITGAAGGLGREYAVRFAGEGARLTIADIKDCAETARRCQAAGGEVQHFLTDVSDEAATKEMAKRAKDRYGRIDGLLNNAGIMRGLQAKSMLDIDMATWDRVMAVNVRGTFLGIRAVFPYMREQGGGTIVNIGSGTMLRVARKIDSGTPHYVASKSAIMGLTRAMAKELGNHNINVVTLAPGSTDSDHDPALPPDQAPAESSVSLKRTGVPADLTGVAAFLFSDDAKFISGQMLVVNGGREVY
jgi:NAD(P)-dependent dehydrogenase (short-subunit alcohol dehydrogenase family)